ncbi:hypothetical protein GCM10011514_35330 [Emticicia aquatilis]|uniref:Fibronectin type-III domain-containing protein n=1 Tax=Emticicia aquatilis TaxID=1537369 RepID=A0A916YZK0_9BACT|nr:gliding motility-associated C-terminal domain-containing protein [Emticicia aquatilis]GGD68127.1 hypothetical protein GCM10011514_35330 [Emticicia aquatilis]
MSRIKFILLWLCAFCITNLSFGQQDTKPAKCTNPGGGILVGGFFDVSPGVGCLNFQTNSGTAIVANAKDLTGGTNFKDLGYIFNFKDGDNIIFQPTLETSKTFTQPGTYWILQGMNINGAAYITCNSFELVQTEVPDLDVSSCGTNEITLTFKKSAANDKHSGYRILWGDGSQEFLSGITPNNFPFTKTHTYSGTPSGQPLIVGRYAKGCESTPLPFQFNVNNKPKISELEGLTGGTSNKITMIEGSDGKAYTIEQKPKNGNWNDTGMKLTRNIGETFKTTTLTGFNATTEYCFRLKTTDGCNNAILSNEVCTIIPKATVTSPKEVKIDWNSPDPTVTRYSVGYSESPTGANPNTGAPVTPTGTTYLFNALDCKKKYDFKVTGFVGTTPNQVVIKSPTILVDPAVSAKLAAKTIGTVSVLNSSTIKFSIYEAGNKADNYIFYRSEGGPNNFVQIKQSTENFYDDKSVEPAKQQYCYKVEYQDECGNTSEPSPAFCSIFLTSTRPNTLNWTQYVIPAPGTFPVDYYVETIDESGNINTVNSTGDTELGVKIQIEKLLESPTTNGEAKFRIRGVQKVKIDIGGGTIIDFPFEVYSNEYIFITPAQLYVPTAFSPNADGFNEVFEIKGRFIAEFNLEVYDRWGNIIFESKRLDDGWKGTASDGVTPAPAGNYGFKVFGLDPAGQKFEKVGSVTLIR